MTRRISMAVAAWLAALMIGGSAERAAACGGDCDGGDSVTVDEIVLAVSIALGSTSVDDCAAADISTDGQVTVDEVLTAVNHALSGCPPPVPTPTATATPTATVPADPNFIPTESGPLLTWLQTGGYQQWQAESARHRSSGPHTANVRSFFNQILLDSLTAGGAVHPRGAAVVKELYGSGTTVRGWAVEVKVADDSDGGRGWYWYERIGTSVFADGTGETGCTGCHSQNFGSFVSKDFVLSRFPLQ